MTVLRRYAAMSLIIAYVMTSCSEVPKGDNIEDDIRTYAYQNRPRTLHDGMEAQPFSVGEGGATIASSDIPWRIPPNCRATYRKWLQDQQPSQPVADQQAFLNQTLCAEKPNRAFVGVAISGGGNKSAVYSTEVLFELKRYGLAEEIDVVSSVSGGSFTAALFGLSCDPGSDCDGANAWRPKWDYQTITRQMETNYFNSLLFNRLRPDHIAKGWYEHHGADDDLATVVGARLLHETDHELTFQDFNPARPNLILNATNVTKSRPDFDRTAAVPEADQRPLSDDDALHFSFTQQYFWRLLSNLDNYPIKRAVVGSAAFPLIIDRPSLRQYRPQELISIRDKQPLKVQPRYVALFDGGVHDNFGVTELRWAIECQLNMPAAMSNAGDSFYRRQCGTARDRLVPKPEAVLVLGINSSLIRSEGSSDTVPKERGFDSFLLPIRISGVSESVDMIMGASGEQRKQQLRRLIRDANGTKSPQGYTPYDRENPMLTSGPYQYVDFDLEAAQILYCKSGDQSQHVERNGNYPGPDPDKRLVDTATGGSDYSRCQALKGVLRWNDDTSPNGRNLKLPTVTKDFCSSDRDCSELLPLIGDRSLMVRHIEDHPGPDADLHRVFFDPDNKQTPRLLQNSLLFDAVRDVPTNFKLSARYTWLLRYTARWVVAHRLWRLCEDNAPLLKAIGKHSQVCVNPLPPREIDDAVGSDAFKSIRF